MKNTLADLNNHLFEELERLNDDELTDEQIDKEMRRADSMSKIATQIIQGGALMLKTMQFAEEYGYNRQGIDPVPELLYRRENRTHGKTQRIQSGNP